MPLKEKILSLPKYKTVTSFFALEVFAFIAFSFGNSYVLYSALSLGLLILLILFSIKEIKVDGIANIIFLIFPLLMFSLLTALGAYMRTHMALGDYTLAEDIFIPIGICSITLCGYLLSLNQTFNIKTFLIVVFSALGILVLINLLINLINFGAFYTLTYKGYYMYYGGKKSSVPVNQMAYILEGFQFVEAKISNYVFYPTLLLSSSVFLFKTSPKKERKTFVLFIAFLVLGLLSLLLFPTYYSLFSILIVGIIDLVMFLYQRYNVLHRPFKIAMVVIIILGSLLFLIMLINNQSFASGISNIIRNNSFLNRILNTNRIIKPFNTMLIDVIGTNFLGFAAHQISGVIYDLVHLSGSFFFDTFMTSGVVGVFALSFALIYGLTGFKNYYQYNQENIRNKNTLLVFILVLYAYSFFFYDGEYGIYYAINKPFYMTGAFMISLFIFAYTMSKGKIDKANLKEVETHETV